MREVVKKRKPGRSEIKAGRSIGVTWKVIWGHHLIWKRLPSSSLERFKFFTLKFDLEATVRILYNSSPQRVCQPWWGRGDIRGEKLPGGEKKRMFPEILWVRKVFTWNIVGYLNPSTERTYLLTNKPRTRITMKIEAAPIFISTAVNHLQTKMLTLSPHHYLSIHGRLCSIVFCWCASSFLKFSNKSNAQSPSGKSNSWDDRLVMGVKWTSWMGDQLTRKSAESPPLCQPCSRHVELVTGPIVRCVDCGGTSRVAASQAQELPSGVSPVWYG